MSIDFCLIIFLVTFTKFFSFLVEQRTQARVANSTIRDDRTANIEPLHTNAGDIPPNFPQDFNAIRNAQSAEITALLTAYGQPTNGNLITRKRRLAKYLGIRSLF
ncbi:5441_t:CDS:1 [Paraglomus brasilianum]|uniref:5441_t:CDS:1 n=1 Tax=Paraglomus brasilianum TaxID=144538 RepID=A0A9N9F9Y6_9GLOM|nr:5441_t:CDS:1 [Paraglomus brasilianum]